MAQYLEFEVSLQGIEPKIWRRFLLKAAASFQDLHEAIQDAGPWEDDHLFRFETAAKRPKRPEPIARADYEDEFDEESAPIAKRVKLSDWFQKKGDRCVYLYDYGDGWQHLVALVDLVESPDKFRRRLTAGARAFPLEDCGGTWGYEECVEASKIPESALELDDPPYDSDKLERREWVGDWDPEAFDLEQAKREFDD
jgi:hypothetical protein